MASDTVPAAPGTTDPNTPALTAGAPSAPEPKGWLASALAPVDPARPTFDLTPTAGADLHDLGGQIPPGADPAAVGPSSGAYHDSDTIPDAKAAAARQQGVVRAWMLAGAERWRKGADARNKRLDIQKAKATALQVKETRSVNRSEKIVGGSTSSGSSTDSRNNAAKSLDNKTAKKDSGGTKNGGAGRSNAGNSSGSAGSGTGGKHGSDHPKNSSSKAGSGSAGSSKTAGATGTSKTAGRTGSSGTDKSSTSSGSGNQGSTGKGSRSGSGKDTKTDHTHSSSGRGGGKPQTTTTCGDASGISKAKDPTGKAPAGASAKDSQPKPGHNSSGQGAGTNTRTAAGTAGPNTESGKTPKTGKDNPKAGNTSADPKTPKSPPTPATGGGPAVNTQASREAGYRDGTRAARIVAHAEAYKDGVKDGFTDTREAAHDDKTRLDQAHAQRKQHRTPPAPSKEQPVTPAATSADYHPPQAPTSPSQAAPIAVDSIDAFRLRLGDGADRKIIRRGEVRTLKQFERTLTTKADRMTRIADGTKALQAHAEEQAKHVTHLQEQAKAVKGGENLAAALSKLQEAATVQVQKAGEIHRRAVRAADNTTVLLANVETRYGGMYKAVVDSDETTPAEMIFYREGSHA